MTGPDHAFQLGAAGEKLERLNVVTSIGQRSTAGMLAGNRERCGAQSRALLCFFNKPNVWMPTFTAHEHGVAYCDYVCSDLFRKFH
jgi:hypothetical protein